MTDWLVADELRDLILQIVDRGETYGFEEVEDATRIEFGLLSWHLGSFYVSPGDEALVDLRCFANHNRPDPLQPGAQDLLH